MLAKDTAICIRAIDYSETSQILTLFAREAGKITAIAKGSKRPKSRFDGPIEIFAHGKIVLAISNKEKLATVTEFEQQPSFTNLPRNLFAFNCSLFAAELLNNLTNDYDPHHKLFDSFLQFLQNISEQQATSNKQRDRLRLLILFQLSLLKEVGLRPILNACVNCKTRYQMQETRYEVYFSSTANGLVCKDCEGSFTDKIRLTQKAANCLSNLKLIADADEKTLKEIERIFVSHFTETLGRPPKMAKYILKS
ncbi:MAG: DNA repair protein RecO [Planctomycetota bacterium]|jgi:DNA repair protein RecO (recombination protein O)